MNREDIAKMAADAGFLTLSIFDEFIDKFEVFANKVASAERERIIAANAPEIQKINAHFKELESAVAAERERCAQICDSIAANAVLGTANECARAIRGQ